MTARVGTMSVDGTPISQADLARIQAEEQLHDEQQRAAAKVVAASALDAEDCRLLLSILGLGGDVAAGARRDLESAPAAKSARKRRAAA